MQLTLDNRTKCGCSSVFSWEYWKRHAWELTHRNRHIRFSISALTRLDELRMLMKKENEDYRWATLQEIAAYGVIPKQQTAASISNSVVWMLKS